MRVIEELHRVGGAGRGGDRVVIGQVVVRSSSRRSRPSVLTVVGRLELMVTS